MVRPVSQFCCGCSLVFGVYFILGLNLVMNLFTLGTTTSNIILKIPTFGYSASLAQQTVNAAVCLLGIPFIIGGIFGVYYRLETNLRLYLVYRVLAFILDCGYIFMFFILQDMCHAMPSAMQQHGSAFACGFMRITALTSTILVLVVETYCIFVVWSLCEDLKAGGCGLGLPELMRSAHNKLRYGAAQYEDEGCYGAGNAFPVAYGAAAAPGIGGGTKLFKGSFHETAFPPAKSQA